MKKYVWTTNKSYDELISLLSLKTYTGFSKYDLVERYKCYPGRYGLYSNVKSNKLTVTINEDKKEPWYGVNCTTRYFSGKLIEKNGITITGRFRFSRLLRALYVFMLLDLFTGQYLSVEKHIVIFAFVFIWWLGMGILGCFAYRDAEKAIIEELTSIFSANIQ